MPAKIRCRSALVLMLGCALACRPARADMRDATRFPAPRSHCLHPAQGRILTSVGTVPAEDGKSFEVVADTRLEPSPGETTEFGDPSLNVFGEGCELVWRQAFPSLAEVGFETLRLPGRSMLYVSAISVFRPGDQVLSRDELLSPAGDEMDLEVSFGGDRYDEAYIGPIGPDGFGIVQTYNPMPWKIGFRSVSSGITGTIQRWQTIPNPDDRAAPPGHGFTNPERLDARQLAAIKRPAASLRPPFPMYRFVFGSPGPE